MYNNRFNHINFLDQKLETFCFENKNYNVFRVGSSLFSKEIKTEDIDYLIVNSTCNKNYNSAINNLKTFFSSDNFVSNTIIINDEYLKLFFEDLKNEFFEEYKINFSYGFNFGPSTLEKNDILSLHIAGPMNEMNVNLFFKKFPLFYIVFKLFNKAIGVNCFDDLFDEQRITQKSIDEGFSQIANRVKYIENISLKRKALKRIKLIQYCIEQNDNAYVIAENEINEISDSAIIENLDKYYS